MPAVSRKHVSPGGLDGGSWHASQRLLHVSSKLVQEGVTRALAATAAEDKCWEVRSSASLGTCSKAASVWA